MASVLESCEKLQSDLDLWFETCSASELREPAPFFDFLTSDINTQGITQEVAPGQGKIRTVKLRYFQRFLESDVDSNQANPNCVATGSDADQVTEYTIDSAVNEQVTKIMSLKDLQLVCRNNPDYIRGLISRMVDVLVRKVATKTTTEAAALAGKWDSEVTVNLSDQLEVRTLRSGTTDEVFPFTMEDIDIAMMQTGYCGNGFMFSGTALYQYYRRVLNGCCANQGVDLGEIAAEYGKAVAYDRRIATAFGDNNNAVVTQPGALALLTYSCNESYDGGVNEIIGLGTNYFHTTVFDPQSGLPMDLNIKDDCGTIHFVLTATTKLVGLPADMFAVGDTKEGVNFFNEILVNNA